MKQQTAVEKLHEESSELVHQYIKGEISARDFIVLHHNLIYDSLKVEKQQIIKARLSLDQSIHLDDAVEKAEEYYDINYGDNGE